jgi:spore coat protein U-like protein
MSRTNRFVAVAAVGLFAMGGLAATAAAQATASITATAAVTGYAPLTASGVNDLNFGSVTAGTPKAPTSMASDAGRFNLSGQPSTPVTVTFTLPTVLSASGGATIPITFGSGDGLLWAPYPASFSTFSPAAPFATSLDATGNLSVGIAGTVSPPVGTVTGTYTGTITLTVAY